MLGAPCTNIQRCRGALPWKLLWPALTSSSFTMGHTPQKKVCMKLLLHKQSILGSSELTCTISCLSAGFMPHSLVVYVCYKVQLMKAHFLDTCNSSQFGWSGAQSLLRHLANWNSRNTASRVVSKVEYSIGSLLQISRGQEIRLLYPDSIIFKCIKVSVICQWIHGS